MKKYVKDKTNGNVYGNGTNNDTHCQMITEALCVRFGTEFVRDVNNHPVLDAYIVHCLEIHEGCCDYESIEQLPEDLFHSEIEFIEREKSTDHKMINAEKYAEQIATVIADNTKCKYWVKEEDEYGYPDCSKCPLKDIGCATKDEVLEWYNTKCK